MTASGDDPVAARRARIAAAATLGRRVGYLALAASVAAFFAGLAAGLPGWSVAVTIGGLVVAIVVLPVPIVLGYGVRAAEREEREERRGGSNSTGGPP